MFPVFARLSHPKKIQVDPHISEVSPHKTAREGLIQSRIAWPTLSSKMTGAKNGKRRSMGLPLPSLTLRDQTKHNLCFELTVRALSSSYPNIDRRSICQKFELETLHSSIFQMSPPVRMIIGYCGDASVPDRFYQAIGMIREILSTTRIGTTRLNQLF